jgi:hypothetical protein
VLLEIKNKTGGCKILKHTGLSLGGVGKLIPKQRGGIEGT